MRSPGINGEGELRGQPANPGSPGKMAVKTECVCVCVCVNQNPKSYCLTGPNHSRLIQRYSNPLEIAGVKLHYRLDALAVPRPTLPQHRNNSMEI